MAQMYLSDLVADGLSLRVWCESCGHHAPAPPAALIDKRGDLPVPEARRFFRCSQCGQRQVSTRPDWPRRGRVARALPEDI